MDELNIIKIGGNIIDDPDLLQAFLADFEQIEGYKILVHGGGKRASDIGIKMALSPNYVDGRRITDAATLELVTMVYGGLINKNIVAQLQALGVNAMGFCGADGALIRGVKRPVQTIDYGFVADLSIDGVNVVLLEQLLQLGIIPVIAPLSLEANGTLLNTNADTIASILARAMAATMQVHLIYCFEQRGVLKNEVDVIDNIDATHFKQLKESGVISGGMIPKISNALLAAGSGKRTVCIGHAADLAELINGTKGTHIL